MPRPVEPPFTLAALVAELGGTLLRGDPAQTVDALASLRDAGPGQVAFLARPAQRAQARDSRAAAIVTTEAMVDGLPAAAAVIVDRDPYGWYARLSRLIAHRLEDRPPAGVQPGAHVHPAADVDATAIVEPTAVVGAGARIGPRAWIGAGCIVGARARVGADTRLHPRVSLLEDCCIGERGIVHSGAVIGADGFGFAPHGAGPRRSGPQKQQRRWHKIAQLGAVVIGDDVEIGANTCIDRGALEDTVIDDGVKLDNLIQVAHGVRIGADTAIAACTGIAGSAVIGQRVQIGGASGIHGHITICDDAVISTMTLISRSITKPGFYSGIYPSMENAQWERSAAVVRNLPELRRRVIALERAVGGAAQSKQSTQPVPHDGTAAPGPVHDGPPT